MKNNLSLHILFVLCTYVFVFVNAEIMEEEYQIQSHRVLNFKQVEVNDVDKKIVQIILNQALNNANDSLFWSDDSMTIQKKVTVRQIWMCNRKGYNVIMAYLTSEPSQMDFCEIVFHNNVEQSYYITSYYDVVSEYINIERVIFKKDSICLWGTTSFNENNDQQHLNCLESFSRKDLIKL